MGALQNDCLVLQAGAHRGESLDLSALPLPGRHNRENAAAAILAAVAFGVKPAAIQPALETFQGLPHRTALIDTINGIRFFNDSKATNIDAVNRALTAFDHPVVLIMGGRNKGNTFRPLADGIRRHVKTLVTLGEAAGNILKELGSLAPSMKADTMADAVSAAFGAAQSGDIVLLSPGCASFDMFNNYQHRGDAFCNAVEALKQNRLST
ncbi:MAG: hypothetical protein JRH15_17970 [Deltaproteobacteria bacterium]|nr:hypothetical protein [Deltaproteobacteria bacterium]